MSCKNNRHSALQYDILKVHKGFALYSKLPSLQSLQLLCKELPPALLAGAGHHNNDNRKAQSLTGRLLLAEGLKYMGLDFRAYQIYCNGKKPYLICQEHIPSGLIAKCLM